VTPLGVSVRGRLLESAPLFFLLPSNASEAVLLRSNARSVIIRSLASLAANTGGCVMRRSRMSRGKSRRSFKKNTGVHKFNFGRPMRGGIRA